MTDPTARPPATGVADFVRDRRLPLLRLAMVLSGDARRAEDIVADVLGRVYEQWPRISRLDQPAAYVRRMVVNEHLSWRRRFRRTVPVAVPPETGATAPDLAAEHADRELMIAELRRLPRQQRVTLVLRYYEDMSDTEIAGLLGCSASTVRSNAARALATLRIHLADTEVAGGEPVARRSPIDHAPLIKEI